MRNWIRRWLGIDLLEIYLNRHARDISASLRVQQESILRLQHDMELAGAAIRENTLPMEDRKVTSNRIAEEAIRKMRGSK